VLLSELIGLKGRGIGQIRQDLAQDFQKQTVLSFTKECGERTRPMKQCVAQQSDQ
jgi:hypothetical protein